MQNYPPNFYVRHKPVPGQVTIEDVGIWKQLGLRIAAEPAIQAEFVTLQQEEFAAMSVYRRESM